MQACPFWLLAPLVSLAACGAGTRRTDVEQPTSNESGTATVSGTAGDLEFAPSVNAIAGTFWGADDGLNVLVTDTRDPCGALAAGQRQPNTTVLMLGFGDYAEGFTQTAARAGDYTFVTQPAAGASFRVIRAYRLDDNCVPSVPDGVRAIAGGGTLDETVPIPGGRAVGSFSANFDEGSLGATFSAPFCNEGSGGDYFTAFSELPSGVTCSPAKGGTAGEGTAGSGATAVPECYLNVDCTAGSECSAGTCVGFVGCNESADCRNNEDCLDSVCRPPCTQNAECADLGLVCGNSQGDTQHCKPAANPTRP